MQIKNTLRRLGALVLCPVLCCGLLTGCGGDEGTYIAAVSGVPDTLDPQLADSEVERIVAVNLFEGLFRLNGDGTARPAACESYTVSEDGLTWSFTLREGLTYNDGDGQEGIAATPVKAADFVFALRRIFTPGTDSPYRAAFAGIAGSADVAAGLQPASTLGVWTSDARTLSIRLAAPDDGLPIKLCSPGAMPCPQEFYQSTQGTYGLEPEALLANGAFRLSLWSSENGVTLRRITPVEGMVNRVRLLVDVEETDPAQRLAQGITSGEFITGMPADADTDTFCVQTQVLLFNCNDPQLAGADVRSGLAGVLHRALPVPEEEGVSTAAGLMPDSVMLGDASWRTLAGDLLHPALPEDPAAVYRQGLAALGRTKLSGITVLVPDTESWRQLYSAVSLAWQKELSAFFSVQYLPEEEIAAAVAAGSYQLAFLTRSARQDDVAAELELYTEPTGYRDAEFDALLTAAAVTASSGEKAALLAAAEARMLSAWPAVPITTAAGYYALAPSCTGVAASPFGPLLDFSEAEWVQVEE